jgi:hypothetical protein
MKLSRVRNSFGAVARLCSLGLFSIPSRYVALANDGAITAGRHLGGLINGYHDSAPVTTRYLLVTQGTAGLGDNHYKLPASVSDMPIAVCQDEPAATTDPVSFKTLLNAAETQLMVAAGAIAAGSLVLTNGDGKVKTAVGAAHGLYWCVGVALTSTVNNNDNVEVASSLFPLGVTIVT